jgi:hypothetical protein
MSVRAISLYFALEKWSSPSVRDNAGEISFYLIFSLVWICVDTERIRVPRHSVFAMMLRSGEADRPDWLPPV